VGPLPTEQRNRMLASRARRVLRAAGIRSMEDLRSRHRLTLLRLRGFGPRAYDFVNEALNLGDEARVRELFPRG
jgi:hypothetical protein